MRPLLPFALAAALAACTAAPPPADAPAAPPPPTAAPAAEAPPTLRLPTDVTPQRYALSLDVDPERDRYTGTVEITAQLTRPRDVIWLHGRELHVASAEAHLASGERVPARWEHVNDEGLAALRFDRPLGPGAVTLRLAFDAPFNAAMEGHFRVAAGGKRYAVTKFEPVAARIAFPCFDEPSFKTPFDLTLTVPKGLVAVGNTRAIEQADAPEGRTRVRFAPTEKLPTYLVAWAVGPFDVVEATLPPTAIRKRPLALRGLATKGRGAELAYAMGRTRGWIEQLEGYFDVEYPYDKLDLIAAPEYPVGAMENAGAIIFREQALLLEEKTASENQRRQLALTVSHEIAHQWFGNLVTMEYWDDLWLNEAFAEWMCFRLEHEASPKAGIDLELLRDIHGAMAADSLGSARKIRQPIETVHDIRNAFDGITYVKGAAVLRMFEHWLGADTFKRGIRAYIADHRHGNATMDHLLSALDKASGRDVGTPFRSFLMQSGVPKVDAKLVCDDAKSAHLALTQSRYLPAGSNAERDRAWQIPVCASYHDGTGVAHACTLLSEHEGRLDLPGPRCPGWVMPNDDGAGYYRVRVGKDDLVRVATARLAPLERLALADSLRAGFDDGSMPAADVFPALSRFATDESRHIAAAPMGLLRFSRAFLADDALRPRVETFSQKLFSPIFRKVAWAPKKGAVEDAEAALFRGEVVTFMGAEARDPAVRREAAARGKEYIGFRRDGRLHPDAVPADLATLAVSVAVQDGDAAVFDAVLALLGKTEDAPVRASLVRALASTHDPKLEARVHALVLDPALRGSEIFPLLGVRFADPATREGAWRWYRDHFDAVVPRIAAQRRQYLAHVTQAFCDTAHADEAQAFFEPKMSAFMGGPRNLATVVEAIRLCAARVGAQREGTRAYFESRKLR